MIKRILENPHQTENSPEELGRVASIVLTNLEKSSKPIKTDDLVQFSGLSQRTVRYGLKLLLDANKIIKFPDLCDLRSFYYKVKI